MAEFFSNYTGAEYDNSVKYTQEHPEVHSELDKKIAEKQDKGNYLTEHQDISHLATKEDLSSILMYDDTEIRNLISGKQDKGNYLTEHQDISHLATKEELAAIPVYDDTEIKNLISEKISEIPGEFITESELEGYGFAKVADIKEYDDTELRNLISEKQDKGNYLTEHQDISHLATKEELDAIPVYDDAEIRELISEKISEIPSEYITEDELNAKGYLTEHQDISGLASKEYVDSYVSDLIDGAPETLDTLKEVSDAIKANEDVVTALNEAIGTKANKSDLEGLATEEFVISEIGKIEKYDDTEVRELISEKQDKGDYLTEHQDISHLSEKSEVASVFAELEKRINLLEEKALTTYINLSPEGAVVPLENSITFIEKPLILEKPIKLDLQGNTITGGIFELSGNSYIPGTSDSYAIWAQEGADITISGDGEVVAQEATYSMAVWAKGGTVTIESGTYRNAGDGCDLIYASAGGKVYIHGGEFYATKKVGEEQGTMNEYTVLNVKDADYKSGASDIVVYGGKFYGFDPANNLSEGEGTNFVAPGYSSVQEGDFYVVSEGVRTEAGFYEAIAAGIPEITLSADIEVADMVTVSNNTLINLNGHKLSKTTVTASGKNVLFYVKGDGAKLTIDGEGQVSVESGRTDIAIWATSGTEVTIKSGEFRGIGCAESSDLIYSQGGKITVEGGSFKLDVMNTEDYAEDQYALLNAYGANQETAQDYIVVKGGKFYDFDPANNVSEGVGTNFVADGYKSVEIEENVFEVQPIA